MTDKKLLVDPLLPWTGPYPYRVLSRFGLGPSSTSVEVLDASYEMSSEEMADPALNDAWETLRLTRERLLVDLFCHELEPPARPAPRPSGERNVPQALLDELAQSLPSLPAPAVTPARLPARLFPEGSPVLRAEDET